MYNVIQLRSCFLLSSTSAVEHSTTDQLHSSIVHVIVIPQTHGPLICYLSGTLYIELLIYAAFLH